MGKRFKSSIAKPDGPRSIGRGGIERLNDGEPWLMVWSQELAVPLATIERKTGIAMDRLLILEREADEPTRDEFEAIAAAMGTSAAMMEAAAE